MNEPAIVADYIGGMKNKELFTKHGIKCRALYRILRHHKIELRGGRHRYGGDSHFFDELNSESKWYWFGFLCADGCLRRNGRLQVTLQRRDSSHLSLFRSHLSYLGPVAHSSTFDKRYQKTYYRCCLAWQSPTIAEALTKQGLIAIKAGDLAPIQSIPDGNYHHFLRGYFDGDGSCFLGGAKKSSWRWRLCSPHQEQLEYMMSRCPVVARSNATRTNKGIWVVQYNGKNIATAIANWLMNDATIYLARKHALVKR